MNTVIRMICILAISMLVACSGSPDRPDNHIPDWVADAQSQVSSGLAMTECASASGNFNVDRRQATALTRQSIAMQLETIVESMEETYLQRTDTHEGDTTTGSTFQSVSRQLTDQTLNGSRVERTGYETIDSQRQLCTMVVIGEEHMRSLFDNIMQSTSVSPEDENALWQQFRHAQARDSMDSNLERRRNR